LLPEQIGIAVAFASFLVFGVLSLVESGRRPALFPAFVLQFAAVSVLLVGIVMRWDRLGQGPFMTLFEVLLSNLFSLSLIYMILYWRIDRIRPAAPLAMALFLVLSVWALAVPADPVVLPPTFDHAWLWIHVIAGKIFLAFCMTATTLAVLLLLCRVTGNQVAVVTAESHDPVVWQLMSVAFVFHSCMLIAGAVWAHDAWGRYWSWDPLETWSLLTWLVLAIVLHARLTFRMPAALGWVLAMAVFILAFLTFFGVPFISQAPHKGVM